MKGILIGTTNAGKLAEFRMVLEASGIACVGLSRFSNAPDCPETGRTFRENAMQKALFFHGFTGLPTVAEDSGLEIEALGGAPGVYSARFAGERAGDRENIRKVLALLKTFPPEQRGARFVCVMAVVARGKVVKTIRRTCRGMILTSPGGEGGFGYDPIFYYPPAGKTFARMERTEKNRVSHRGKALRALATFLA